MELKKKVILEVDQLKPELLRIHKTIHRNPELGLQEFRASALLADFLEAHGFRVRRGIADLPTAFRADAGLKNKRPRVAFLAEYDALPGLGHACGHSIIAAAAVGAAAVLHKIDPHLPLTVMGTPAEEIGVGKGRLIEAGEFSGIDAAMMVHPSSRRIVLKYYLGVSSLIFTFSGRAAHAAAYPEHGINALDAVILLFTAVSALRQQLPEEVRVHGIVTDGGKAPNIIPDRAQAEFLVRAMDMTALKRMQEKVITCARGAAESTGCKLNVQVIEASSKPLKVNYALTDLYREQLAFLGLKEFPARPDKHLGSSDVGNVSQIMPTIHPHVPVARPGSVAIHTGEFEKAAGGPDGRAAVLEGAKCLALTAYDLISRKDVWNKIQKEFRSG